MEIAGHVALVTGGAVRIGAATCCALAAGGCHVAIHCNRSRDEADALADELREMGVRAWVVPGNLAEAAEAVIDDAWREAGAPLDMLINNAAVFHRAPLVGLDEAAMRSELEINLLAPVLLARRFAERLRADAAECCVSGDVRGRIVNLLDRRVSGNEPGAIPYMLSKKGLADFTRCAALEWAPEIAVNGVAPGAVLAPPAETDGGSDLKTAAGRIPLNVAVTPEHVAEAVVFALTSDVMTGQVLYVDGGQHLLGGTV